jgi:hypothetical protein
MKRGAALLSLAILLLFCSSADAAIRKWSIDPGIYGGYDYIDGDADLDNTFFGGARIGLAVWPSLIFEVTFDSISTESSEFSDSDYTEDSYGIRLLGTFRAGEDVKVVPYVVGGYGVTDVQFDRGGNRGFEDDETSHEEIGAGVRYFITKDLSLRPEIIIKHFRAADVTHADVHYQVGVSYFLFGKK